MNIKRIIFILCVAGGCFAAELAPQTWDVDGETREALVYMPEKAENAPLVFVFHGHGGNVQRISGMFRIHELWPEAAVVYMQGLQPLHGTIPTGREAGGIPIRVIPRTGI